MRTIPFLNKALSALIRYDYYCFKDDNFKKVLLPHPAFVNYYDLSLVVATTLFAIYFKYLEVLYESCGQ